LIPGSAFSVVPESRKDPSLVGKGLREESIQQARVPARDSDDGRDSIFSPRLLGQIHTGGRPALVENCLYLFEAGHAEPGRLIDQNQPFVVGLSFASRTLVLLCY